MPLLAKMFKKVYFSIRIIVNGTRSNMKYDWQRMYILLEKLTGLTCWLYKTIFVCKRLRPCVQKGLF